MYHQIAFGSIQLFSIARIIYLVKYRLPPSSQHPAKKTVTDLMIRGIALFVAAFVVWNLDNAFCDLWRGVREKVAPFGFLVEGHGEPIIREDPSNTVLMQPLSQRSGIWEPVWAHTGS